MVSQGGIGLPRRGHGYDYQQALAEDRGYHGTMRQMPLRLKLSLWCEPPAGPFVATGDNCDQDGKPLAWATDSTGQCGGFPCTVVAAPAPPPSDTGSDAIRCWQQQTVVAASTTGFSGTYKFVTAGAGHACPVNATGAQ